MQETQLISKKPQQGGNFLECILCIFKIVVTRHGDVHLSSQHQGWIQRQVDLRVSKASPSFMASSRTARATQ